MKQQPLFKDKIYNLKCPKCGSKMVLKNSKTGTFYGCSKFPKCKGSRGADRYGRLYDKPANKLTKAWRMLAHDKFDMWWRYKGLSRNVAYQRLQSFMNMPPDKAHIGNFDIAKCKKVIEYCSMREVIELCLIDPSGINIF